MQLETMPNVEHSVITDMVLAQQVLAGDSAAFESLVRRYSTSLYSFITRFLGDHDQASDILQQVFIQLYTSLPTLRTDKPLKAWLFQVARNRCVDELRRKRILHFSELEAKNDEDEVSIVDALLDTTPLPEELAESHDLQERLQEAIDTLPVKFRSVVLLRYVGQLSFPEIGQALNMPVATAKTYFHRAKPLLRTALIKKAHASDYCLQ
jgi:RNA polymerase sigma factor (sigma-70 family)